jgi:hypothetical protein
MASSTNYLWAEPDNSSLVKNGASDIRTLGNAIDTSVWNVGYGQAGKNKVINGNFGIWQRGTSFTSNVSGETYTADRWVSLVNGTGTRTVAQQTFTPGTAPVAGYEGQYFLRLGCSASGTATYFAVKQRIEDVRTFAGQTVTISFWAKASATLSTTFFGISQSFGSGGSGGVDTAGTNLTFTTSWVRYTQTFAVPSVAGKTIGTGSNVEVGVSLGSGTFTSLDIWGFQVEYGSTATPFQTASGGSPQAELAMCQRYFERQDSALGTQFTPFGTGACASTTTAYSTIFYTYKRTSPSLSFATASTFSQTNSSGASVACTAISSAAQGVNTALILGTVASGLVAGNATTLYRNTANLAYIDISAEL